MSPMVKMGRKLSRKEKVEARTEEEDVYSCKYQEISDAGLRIPEEFISEMTEAFSLFDKAKFYAKENHSNKNWFQDKNGISPPRNLEETQQRRR